MKVAIDKGPLESGHAIRGIGVHTRKLVEEVKKLENKEIKIKDYSSRIGEGFAFNPVFFGLIY